MQHLSLIAAVSDDGFISPGKGVPWDLPDDRKHFRAHTAGRHLLLGRTTYEEMTGWFDASHSPLVLSRDRAFVPPVGRRVPSVQVAIMQAEREGARELVVCGGAQTYAAAMSYADTLLITRVHTNLGQGIAFPEILEKEWKEESRIDHPADRNHALAMSFITLRRSARALRRR